MASSTPLPHFTPGKDPVPILREVGWAPGPVWTGGNSRPHRDSIPNRPPRSQSLYPLLISRCKVFFNSEPNHLECCAPSTGNGTGVTENQTGSTSGIKQSKKTILLALFNPEDEDTTLLRNVGNVYRPTQRSIPEESSASL